MKASLKARQDIAAGKGRVQLIKDQLLHSGSGKVRLCELPPNVPERLY